MRAPVCLCVLDSEVQRAAVICAVRILDVLVSCIMALMQGGASAVNKLRPTSGSPAWHNIKASDPSICHVWEGTQSCVQALGFYTQLAVSGI